MKILFLAAEVGPFVTVGGLSQVMYFLPRALVSMKHDVHIFTPRYGRMSPASPSGKKWKFSTEIESLRVPVQSHVTGDDPKDAIGCRVLRYLGKRSEPTVHFLENKEYYELRANVFGYSDDHVRFTLLCRAALEWLRNSGESLPDVIHCNDWHTAYFIQLARQDRRYKQLLAKVPILFSVHNFQYQGNMSFKYLTADERDDGSSELASLYSDKLILQNALLRGIRYADTVNTVSPTHAVEALTPEYGEGLETDLQNVRGKITGILNGLDTREFNPSTDPIIKKQYNETTVNKVRPINKKNLQKTFLLPEDPNRIILIVTGRINRQKGWDLMIDVFPQLLQHDESIQIIVLGDGDETYKKHMQQLQLQYPDRIGLHLRSDFRLPRKLFAGGDIVLIPSYFEPGGIVALEALRYGLVPVVRRTGGLADIVEDYDVVTGRGNGFSFKPKNPWVLYGKIIEAVTVYKNKNAWKKLVQNCMSSDFSWMHAAHEYVDLYHNVITERKRAISATPHPAYNTPQA